MPQEKQFIFSSRTIEEIQEKQNKGYILHRFENPWFKNQIGVRKSGLTFKMTPEELEEYAKCKQDIKYFARKCRIKNEEGMLSNVSFEGREYQEELLEMIVNNRFSIINASRQIGKTISSAISILWYCIFNVDKNVMIIANKGKTVREILDKIKSIYMHLPFYLKPGVNNFAAQSISFGDTGCRIMTEARTKEPAIGFTIDFLYLDEFAHIPRNIIEPYYRAAYPTVSSVKNSKIVITSTPNGYNLFWKLLDGAERLPGDPKKNNFNAKRVYWYEVPGRAVSYIRLHPGKLQNFEITPRTVFDALNKKYDLYDKSELVWVEENNRYEIHIQQSHDLNLEEVRRFEIEADIFDGMFPVDAEPLRIAEISEVTSWKEETIKDIGSEEAFNQEYGLRFLSGSKLMFDEVTLTALTSGKTEFKHETIDAFTKYPHIRYENLQWIQDKPEIFSLGNVKEDYFVLGVDLSEGLGQDYSVVNIFKLHDKDEELWNHTKIESIYDYFGLTQVGIFRHNLMSVKNLAEFLYVLCFEVLDPEKVKVVLEYNTYGAELLAHMPSLYNGMNEYSSHIFAKFKHRADAKKPKTGLKVHGNKPSLVKEYQNRVINKSIVPREETTIREMSTFIKKETSTGKLTFSAESGHDDIVMTIVDTSQIFGNVSFKNLVDEYMENKLDEQTKRKIEENMKGIEYLKSIDYQALHDARKKIRMEEEYQQMINNMQSQF